LGLENTIQAQVECEKRPGMNEKRVKKQQKAFNLMPLDVVDYKFHNSVIFLPLNLKEFFRIVS